MCGLCSGDETITQVGPESGHEFNITRHIEDDGTFDNYFIVEECDQYGNTIIQTYTPDLEFCPWCGDPL